ncbi:MAG: protoheme IX farnesyltransferase [Bermanella sp.]|jgi:protoheme IX farnesyltransferase
MEKASMLERSNRYSETAKDYFAMTKFKVVVVMLFTVMVGFLLASSLDVNFIKLFYTLLGVAGCTMSGAVLNHLVDRHRDAKMQRTKRRPVATGKVSAESAFIFSMLLLVGGGSLLYFQLNPLTALLSVLSMFAYGVVYSVWLKPATPQNITVGGLAGAMPPLLGYTAVTGQVGPEALLWVLIIFTWTPPHFWALAIYKKDDYEKAGVPMMPVTHGISFTAFQAWLYCLLLCVVSIAPVLLGSQGMIYLVMVTAINARFTWLTYCMWCSPTDANARKTFRFSIVYIMWLFAALLLDHYVRLIAF